MAGYHTFTTPKSQAKIERILTELEQLEMTRDELQCLLGISKPTMHRYIDHLSAAPKRIFVRTWRPTMGELAPVYAVGNQPDAPRPAPITKQERNAREWRRIKGDRDRHDRVKAAARVGGTIRKVRGSPQPWFAALDSINRGGRDAR